MKKIAILLIFISGCMTYDQIRTINRENLLKLSVGMTKEEALSIMGTETIELGLGAINNPYRSEILEGNYEILYYYTDQKSAHFIGCGLVISDDDLTPLVFEDQKLIGWGRNYLDSNLKIVELRLR